MQRKCKSCGKTIVHFDGKLWHAIGESIFPQYCVMDMENGSKLHEPADADGISMMDLETRIQDVFDQYRAGLETATETLEKIAVIIGK